MHVYYFDGLHFYARWILLVELVETRERLNKFIVYNERYEFTQSFHDMSKARYVSMRTLKTSNRWLTGTTGWGWAPVRSTPRPGRPVGQNPLSGSVTWRRISRSHPRGESTHVGREHGHAIDRARPDVVTTPGGTRSTRHTHGDDSARVFVAGTVTARDSGHRGEYHHLGGSDTRLAALVARSATRLRRPRDLQIGRRCEPGLTTRISNVRTVSRTGRRQLYRVSLVKFDVRTCRRRVSDRVCSETSTDRADRCRDNRTAVWKFRATFREMFRRRCVRGVEVDSRKQRGVLANGKPDDRI